MNHDLLVWFQNGRNRRLSFSKTKGGQFIACLQRYADNDCFDGIGGTPEEALTDALEAVKERELALTEVTP